MMNLRIVSRAAKYFFKVVLSAVLSIQAASLFAETTYVHTDYLGSVVAESNTSGNITKRFYFRPFGEGIGETSGDRPAYTGHVYDGDFNLVYMQQRYYDPAIGRFISNDPIAFLSLNPASFNRYAYVRNNPYKYIDPNGEYGEAAFEAVSLAIGANSLRQNLSDGKYGAAAVDAIGLTVDAVLAFVPIAPGVSGLGIQATRAADDVTQTTLSNSDNVVRGGTSTAERFQNGTGVTTQADGTLDNVSVNSGPGVSVEELSNGIPNNQIGVTTVGDIRAAGGDVVPSRTENNEFHCTMCGLTPEKAEELFTPTIPNPSKVKPDKQ